MKPLDIRVEMENTRLKRSVKMAANLDIEQLRAACDDINRKLPIAPIRLDQPQGALFLALKSLKDQLRPEIDLKNDTWKVLQRLKIINKAFIKKLKTKVADPTQEITIEQLRAAAADVNETLGLDPPIEAGWGYATILKCLGALQDMYDPSDSFKEDTWKTLKALNLISPKKTREIEAKGIKLKEVQRSRIAALVAMGWDVDRKDLEEWSVHEWVAELVKWGNPWVLLLKRKSLADDIIVLEAAEFFKLLEKIPEDRKCL